MGARWTSRLSVVAAKIQSGSELTAQRVGTQIVQEAKDRVPVATSSLQRTIRLVGPLNDGSAVHYQVIAGDPTAQRLGYSYTVYYAPIVEYSIKPYLTPAAMTVDVVREAREAVQLELRSL